MSGPNRHSKEWDSVFSKDRNFKEDKSNLEWKRSINAEGDESNIFLQDSEDSVPSCKVEEVAEFCRGACFGGLESGAGTAGRRRGAWLDDRSYTSKVCHCSNDGNLTRNGGFRGYENPLTATGLSRLLKAPV
jgi:hypothetical protein